MHNGQPFRLDDGGPFSFREGVLYDGGVAVDELAAAAGTPRLPVCTRRCGGRVPATPERVPSRPGPLLRQGERQPRPAAAAGRHRGRVRRGQRGRAAPGPAGRWPPRPDRVRRGRQDRPGARRCRAFWGGAARRVGRRAGGLQAVAAGLGARVGSGCGSTRTWKPDSIPIFAPATTRPSSACRQAPRSSCIGGSWPATTPTSTRSGSMSTLVPSSPARATRPPGPGSRPACSKRAGGSGSPSTGVDVGGGLPVDYDGGPVSPPEEFAAALTSLVAGAGGELKVEPGRSLVAKILAVTSLPVLIRRHGVDAVLDAHNLARARGRLAVRRPA